MPDPRSTAAQAALAAGTALRNLRDDPVGFALLLARRFAPASRGRLGRTRPGDRGLARALRAYLADSPDAAASALRARAATGGGRSRPGDRFAARLAVAVGAPDAVGPRLADDPRIASDDAWLRGDLSRAVELLGPSRTLVARRRRSELASLQPGFRLPVPGTSAGRTPTAPAAGQGRARVLHLLTNSLPHTRSGYTARTHALLRACADAGLDVAAVTRIGYPVTIGRAGVERVDVVDGIPYHRVLPARLPVTVDARLAAQADAIAPLVERFRPGVLHTTTDYTNALVTQAVAARHGLPWVYEMRGQLELTWIASRPEAARTDAATSERVRLLRAKEAELATSADAVVVLSRVQADDMAARGVPADRILVAPNSVDPDLLARDETAAWTRASLGLPREGTWAGTVSSLVDYEGLDTFLRALALAREAGVDLRGAIVGEGASRPALRALAEDLGVADAVTFPGRVPRDQAIRWHQALDVFVVPRRDTPVCRMVTPLKPIEAMALGRPVLASDLPALREIVADPGSGRVLPAEDAAAWASALTELASDPAQREAYGERGRAFAAGRTWRHVAESYRSLYAGLGGADVR